MICIQTHHTTILLINILSLKGKNLGLCLVCGTLTNWVDFCFEAGMCSEECSDKGWKEYQEACKNYNPT
jgi:hypothetical protein